MRPRSVSPPPSFAVCHLIGATVESCCEASNDQWKQGLVEQGGVVSFEESSPLAQKSIIKAAAPWPDINQQRILCGQVTLYLLPHGCFCGYVRRYVCKGPGGHVSSCPVSQIATTQVRLTSFSPPHLQFKHTYEVFV